MTFIKRIFAWLKARQQYSIEMVTVNLDGFTYRKDMVEETILWSEINRIITFKVDCYTIDMIWLAFVRQENDLVIQIREEAEGFKELMSALDVQFPTIDPEWFMKVAQPPFAENFTILFDRKNQL